MAEEYRSQRKCVQKALKRGVRAVAEGVPTVSTSQADLRTFIEFLGETLVAWPALWHAASGKGSELGEQIIKDS